MGTLAPRDPRDASAAAGERAPDQVCKELADVFEKEVLPQLVGPAIYCSPRAGPLCTGVSVRQSKARGAHPLRTRPLPVRAGLGVRVAKDVRLVDDDTGVWFPVL